MELRDQLSDLRAKLATVAAQRDAAVHDAEREEDHGDQRVDDLRARREEENRRLHEELAALRGDLITAHVKPACSAAGPTEPKPDSTTPPWPPRRGAARRTQAADGVEMRPSRQKPRRPDSDTGQHDRARPCISV